MWIPPTRPVGQHNTAYIGLDADQQIGFAQQAEQRNGGEQPPTEPWEPPRPPTAFRLASSVGYRTDVPDEMAYIWSTRQTKQPDPVPLDARTRRHTKAERQAFGSLITTSVPAQHVSAARTPAENPEAVAPEQTQRASRPATAATTDRKATQTLG
jgi:hypothetical protein